MDKTLETFYSIAALIAGVAILSVLVSNKANTVGVIQSLASGFGNSLAVAQSPVTGASVTPNLSYPSGGLGDVFGNFGTTGLP